MTIMDDTNIYLSPFLSQTIMFSHNLGINNLYKNVSMQIVIANLHLYRLKCVKT